MRWSAGTPVAGGVVVLVLLGLLLALRQPAAAPHADPPPEEPAGVTPTGPWTARDVDALLRQVRVVPRRPQVPGYDRDCGPGEGCVFGPSWTDDTDAPDGHDGCDTRNDVLAAQLVDVAFSARSPGCDVVAGVLHDPYTGAVMSYAEQGAQIHVDHLVPLAAAWDLGAAAWTPARRARFANDTALELLAVQGSANLAKGDSTPASWLPPVRAWRCEYVGRYLRASVAYDLAVTAADREVIGFVQARSCPP